MGKTSIEWTDYSINPIRARRRDGGGGGHWCVKISPGCAHCYASATQPRLGMYEFTAGNAAKVEPFFAAEKLQEVLRRRKPTKWFWCDMTDMFGEWVQDVWIYQCLAAMVLTPRHTHQVLTKRPERALLYLADPREYVAAWTGTRALYPAQVGNERRAAEMLWPLPNLWLGVSVEDRKHGVPRIDVLRQIPAAVRFLSIEPLIEGLGTLNLDGIHWVIVGGESGPGARPMNLHWVRSIIHQCEAASVLPCFVKQLGKRPFDQWGYSNHTNRPGLKLHVEMLGMNTQYELHDSKGGNPVEWPEEFRVREFPTVSPSP